MREKKLNISAGTIARTIILALALINQVLTTTGHSVIPLDDTVITEFITNAFTIGAALVAFWKNNSFTQEAIKADEYMALLKSEKSE